MGIRPTFLVIGAMKCGTTSLYDLLAGHPQIGMSTVKEPAFFCCDELFNQGWWWYESHFAHAAGCLAVGEASTSYTKKYTYPRAAERIAKHLPEARLIYIVRDPLERIESQWIHGAHTGWHAAKFAAALDDPGLIDPSRYWRQISAYRDFFPDERILVLFFDDFKADPLRAFAQCCEFLSVDQSRMPNSPMLPRNVSSALESETAVLAALRCLPLFHRLVRSLSADCKNRLKQQYFTRRIEHRPIWPPDKRRRAIREIADDVHSFLTFYGRPADFWRLE
jgi:hypothetical protein